VLFQGYTPKKIRPNVNHEKAERKKIGLSEEKIGVVEKVTPENSGQMKKAANMYESLSLGAINSVLNEIKPQ